jgi:hypothetical protein
VKSFPLPLLLILPLIALHSQSAENFLRDGGFEQYLAQPDDQGNPFKLWSGWKWEGNCQRIVDPDIKHAGHPHGHLRSPLELSRYEAPVQWNTQPDP